MLYCHAILGMVSSRLSAKRRGENSTLRKEIV